MVFVRPEPASQVILTEDERAAQMQADGATDADIEAALLLRATETMKRQTEFDQHPPSVAYVRVPT